MSEMSAITLDLSDSRYLKTPDSLPVVSNEYAFSADSGLTEYDSVLDELGEICKTYDKESRNNGCCNWYDIKNEFCKKFAESTSSQDFWIFHHAVIGIFTAIDHYSDLSVIFLWLFAESYDSVPASIPIFSLICIFTITAIPAYSLKDSCVRISMLLGLGYFALLLQRLKTPIYQVTADYFRLQSSLNIAWYDLKEGIRKSVVAEKNNTSNVSEELTTSLKEIPDQNVNSNAEAAVRIILDGIDAFTKSHNKFFETNNDRTQIWLLDTCVCCCVSPAQFDEEADQGIKKKLSELKIKANQYKVIQHSIELVTTSEVDPLGTPPYKLIEHSPELLATPEIVITPQGSELETPPEVHPLEIKLETFTDLDAMFYTSKAIDLKAYEVEDSMEDRAELRTKNLSHRSSQLTELQSILGSTRSFLSLQMLILDTPKAYKLLENAFESVPQMMIQLYVILKYSSDTSWFAYVSLCMSIFSLSYTGAALLCPQKFAEWSVGFFFCLFDMLFRCGGMLYIFLCIPFGLLRFGIVLLYAISGFILCIALLPHTSRRSSQWTSFQLENISVASSIYFRDLVS